MVQVSGGFFSEFNADLPSLDAKQNLTYTHFY